MLQEQPSPFAPISTFDIRINEIQRRMILQSCIARAKQLMTGAEAIQDHEAEELLTLIQCMNSVPNALSTTGLNSLVL